MKSTFLTKPVTRRQFVLGSAAGATLLSLGAPRVLLAAQAASSGLDALGYPTLNLTVSESGYQGMPSSTAAGRYLVRLTGNGINEPAAAGFMSPVTAGKTVQEVISFLASAGGPPPGASPSAGGGGTPPAGQGGQQESLVLPDWVYRMTMAGGPYIAPGQTAEAVIDLIPGDWILWGDDPSAPQKPVTFTVTGEFPKDIEEPTADIEAMLVDFAITLKGTLTKGPHIVKITDNGAEPHFLILEELPAGTTRDQLMAMVSSTSNATPPPGVSSTPVFESAAQSLGTTYWQTVDFPQDGTYGAACFFPTAGTGVPHAMNGMIDVFQVTG